MSEPENMLTGEPQSPPPPQRDGRPQAPDALPQEPLDAQSPSADTPAPTSDAPQKTPFFYKSGVIALLIIFLWPVGLALMWSKGCTWKKNAKIAVTVISLVLVAANLFSVYKALQDAANVGRTQSATVITEPLESEAAQESVKTTEELLSTSDKSSYTATALLSSPNPNELLSGFSDFEPQKIVGTGKQTIDLSAYTEPVLLSLDYEGEDLISLWAGEPLGSNSVLLVNSIGRFHGTTTTLLAGDPPSKLTLEESGDSAWTLTISPLNRMPNAEANATYYQSQVLLVAPENQSSMSKFSFSMTSSDATNSFEAYAMGKNTGKELALESGQSYSGEADWQDLPCILMVMTDGEWHFNIA